MENQVIENGTEITEKKAVKAKWYEADGAFPYKNEEKVAIVDGRLNGRFAIVIGPSAKQNAVKARLINQKTNELQGTKVTLDFNNIVLASSIQNQEVAAANDESSDQTEDQEVV